MVFFILIFSLIFQKNGGGQKRADIFVFRNLQNMSSSEKYRQLGYLEGELII